MGGDAARARTHGRATYEDVLRAPENVVAEIVAGELRLHPRPAKPHAAATAALGEELGPPFKRGRGGPGGGSSSTNRNFTWATILVPDLAGWRRERMPVLTDDEPYFTLAPDWVCEVLSASTAKMDRSDKLPIYAREAVGQVWLVDPILRTLEVLAHDPGGGRLLAVHRDDARVRAQPFDAFELDLAILWADVQLR